MGVDTEVDHRMGGKVRSQPVDWVIADLAERQHGVVARRQLLAAGCQRPASTTRFSRPTRSPSRGIPVTTIARTLFDVAHVAPAKFERAATEAELRRLGGGASLEALAARHPRKRGVVAVRALLAAGRVGAGITRSELALLGA